MIDVRNTSPTPLVIDVARATIALEALDSSERTSARPEGAGTGGLPNKVNADRETLRPLTVPPGQDLTFWIMFEPVQVPEFPDITLSVPLQTGGPFVFKLQDTAPPRWRSMGRNATGMTIRMTSHHFGRSKSIYTGPGLVLWHARGPITFAVAGDTGQMYERFPTGLQRAFSGSLEASLSWRPPSWPFGLYSAGHVTAVDFDEDPTIRNRGFPGFSAGLEVHFLAGVMRFGYTRVFDDSISSRNALSVSVGARLGSW